MKCYESLDGVQSVSARVQRDQSQRDRDDLFSLVSLIPGRNKLVITFLQSWTRYKNLIYDYTAYKLWYIQISAYHTSQLGQGPTSIFGKAILFTHFSFVDLSPLSHSLHMPHTARYLAAMFQALTFLYRFFDFGNNAWTEICRTIFSDCYNWP